MPHHLLTSPTAVSWFLPRRRRVVTHSSAPRVLGHHVSHPHIASHDQTGWTRCNMVIMWKVQEQKYDQNIWDSSHNYQIETSINFMKLSQCFLFHPRCIDTDHSGTAVASCGIANHEGLKFWTCLPFLFDLYFIHLVVCNSIEKIQYLSNSQSHPWIIFENQAHIFSIQKAPQEAILSHGEKI